MKRGVTELITPGVATSEKMLDTKSNNYLASFHIENVKDKRLIGMSFLDISTGEFFVAQGNPDYCEKLLHSLQPAEIILSKSNQKIFKELFGNKFYLYTLDDWIFTTDFAKEKLLHHFNTSTLKGFGIEELHLAIIGAGSTLHYLGETEHNNLGHITSISRLAEEQYVWLDRFTIRNLELLHSPMEDGIPLYSVLDKTITPMGTRLLKRWIIMPLKDKQSIEARHDTVESFIKDAELSKQVSNSLKIVGDLERLISKVSLQKITPREVIQLNRAIHALEPLRKTLLQNENIHLRKSGDRINTCDIIRKQIDDEIIEDAPNQINKGNIIRKGVNAELDELRAIGSSGKDYLVQLQQKEIERTGITNLKIGFNNVFGYYLEVTNRFKDSAPEDWIRKQTLTNAERYITPELKVYEEKILGAEEKIIALEQTIFETLVHTLNEYVKPIQLNAQIIAQLDCLLSFATIAMQSSYRRPELNTGNALRIKEGRHPVIEKHLPIGEKYVPNDIYLNNDDQQIMIITGPNMAGKSALLRQTALIVMMAQMGSFVPATEAQIGIVDKIFTRVGASDNISSGESTFMVEMTETASIMNNISANSLILLDEIGRGTSTFDGISIAWSLCEYLHNNITAHPKTLFATHYHELSELENRYERIHNFHVATKEAGNKVIFLRTLQPGSIKHSFGIHVARMAGMPKEIVDGANEVLKELEQKNLGSELQNKLRKVQKQTYQLSIFGMDNPELLKVKEILDNLDINALSPIEALMKLKELKEIMQV